MSPKTCFNYCFFIAATLAIPVAASQATFAEGDVHIHIHADPALSAGAGPTHSVNQTAPISRRGDECLLESSGPPDSVAPASSITEWAPYGLILLLVVLATRRKRPRRRAVIPFWGGTLTFEPAPEDASETSRIHRRN